MRLLGGAVLQLSDATGGSNAVDPGGRQRTFVNLGAGTIDHIVNDTGAPVTPDDVGLPSYVVSYP